MKQFRFAWILIIFFSQCLFSATLKQNNVSLREGMGAFYPVIAVLNSGDNVEIISENEGWNKVKAGVHQGWVPSSAFTKSGSSINYGALAGEIADRTVSKTMVTAAVKGFFENNIQSDKINKEIMNKPVRRYFSPSDYLEFKNETFRGRSWKPEKYKRKIKITKSGSLMIDEGIIATSSYIAGRLTADGVVSDYRLNKYVNLVAQLVAASTEFYDFPITVHISDTDELFANALPIGVVVLSKGILNEIQSEHELACLIGHELSHITLQHGAEETARRKPKFKADDAFAELDEEFGNERFELDDIADEMFERSIKGRKDEYEGAADLRGALYAARAGYDPSGMVSLMSRLQGKMKRSRNPEDVSHWFPYSFDKRIKNLQKYCSKNLYRYDAHYKKFQARYQSMVR